jgi:hypothetical protein
VRGTSLRISLILSLFFLGCLNETKDTLDNKSISSEDLEISITIDSVYKKIELAASEPKLDLSYNFGQEVYKFDGLIIGIGDKKISVPEMADSTYISFFVVYDSLGTILYENQLTYPNGDAIIFINGFHFSKKTNRLIVNCNVGMTEYFFADIFFLIENHKVSMMGETCLASMDEDLPMYELWEFRDFQNNIILDIKADSVYVDFGGDYRKTVSTGDIRIFYDLTTEKLKHYYNGARTNSIFDYLFPENIDSIESTEFSGWIFLDKTIGDINLDGLDDLVLVAQENDSSKIEAGEYGELIDLNPRVLLVYFYNEDGYSKHLQKLHFIPIKDNINMEDPLDEVTIDSNNVLTH